MRTYWDTSAAINAAVSPVVAARLDQGEHITRLHLLEEFFSTMTGRGVVGRDADGNPVRVLFRPADCVTWLRDFCSQVAFVELTPEELLAGLEKAQGLSVQGARVYDFSHALAALKGQAEELATRNTGHFEGLVGKTKLVWP